MEPITRAITSVDWITAVLFSSLLFVAIAKNVFYVRFMNFIILPFNNKYIFMYNKKDRLLNWFHIFLTLFFLLNFALFLYLSLNILSPSEASQYPSAFLLILGFLALYLISKGVLQMWNGFVFNNSRIISEFIFKKISYLNYSGLLLFLANIFLMYVLKGSVSVVYIVIFLFILINSIGWFTALKTHQKYITNNFFYFILYLCALEIAPLIFIANYLTERAI